MTTHGLVLFVLAGLLLNVTPGAFICMGEGAALHALAEGRPGAGDDERHNEQADGAVHRG